MANVYQRGSVWWVRWRDGVGVERRKSTTAKNKREAQSLLAELVGQAQRVRLGLEAAPVEVALTLKQLCDWWLDERCPEASRDVERLRLGKHVLRTPLAKLPLSLVTADAIEARFEAIEKSSPRAAATVNRLRNTLHSVFEAARQPPRRFTGKNPVAETRVRQVLRLDYRLLKPEEVFRALAVTRAIWQGPVATAAFLGLRKGEIFGLRKTDYDKENQTLLVAASHQRRTTKGKRVDLLPVPGALRPYIERALDAKGPVSHWLFPDKEGRQRTKEADPHLVLRRACARADIADEWKASCRRCTHDKTPQRVHVLSSRPKDLRCPIHHCKLWVKAVPLNIRFHDLRHSVATTLIRNDVSLPRVQRIIRHADISTTIKTYGHLALEDLREAVEHSSSQRVATSAQASGTNPAQQEGSDERSEG